MLTGSEAHELTSTNQPESINLKSLFDEEIQSASTVKEPLPDERSSTEVKEPVKKASSSNKSASKQQPSAKSTTYVVKKGDTLSKIAQKFYGSPLKWKRIVEANKATLGSNNVLKVGMKLTIPLDE